MTTPTPKPVRSWWNSHIKCDSHGKYDPVFDGDWSFKQTCKFHRIKEKLPDPKLQRLKLVLRLAEADKDRPAWQASEKERLIAKYRELVRSR